MPILSDFYYHLYDGGDALSPPVVLIHGIGGTHLDWPAAIRRLPGFPIYALDLPGHGKSRNHAHQSVQGYAETLLSWLDAVGLYRVVFVGYSLGSSIALYLGSRHPERVAGLAVLANENPTSILPDILEDIANPATYAKGVQQLAGQYVTPHIPFENSAALVQRLSENRPSVLHSDLLACSQFDINGQLAFIHAPTLILCGENDPFAPVRRAQYLVNAIPSAQLVVIPGTNHLLLLEQTQRIVSTLADFLAKIPYLPGQG
jgi:pimeloyl-ACP methyl ester carboxylesterase